MLTVEDAFDVPHILWPARDRLVDNEIFSRAKSYGFSWFQFMINGAPDDLVFVARQPQRDIYRAAVACPNQNYPISSSKRSSVRQARCEAFQNNTYEPLWGVQWRGNGQVYILGEARLSPLLNGHAADNGVMNAEIGEEEVDLPGCGSLLVHSSSPFALAICSNA